MRVTVTTTTINREKELPKSITEDAAVSLIQARNPGRASVAVSYICYASLELWGKTFLR